MAKQERLEYAGAIYHERLHKSQHNLHQSILRTYCYVIGNKNASLLAITGFNDQV